MAEPLSGQEPAARGQEPHAALPAEVAAPPSASPSPAGQEPEPERFDAEYVRKLRAEAAEYRRRMRELEGQVKQYEEARLSETERLQKRLAELERELTHIQQERQERILRYETMLAAQRLGIVDPEAAYRLLDLSSLEYDDAGQPTNLEQALKQLVAKKPYLAGQGQLSAGAPTNPATGGPARTGTFTASQIADRRFYEQHREEILQALAEGRILPG